MARPFQRVAHAPGRWAGRRPGRAGRAWPRTRWSTDRCPAEPGGRGGWRRGPRRRAAAGRPRRPPAARARVRGMGQPEGSAAARTAGSGNTCVTSPTGRASSAVGGHQPPGQRGRAGQRDLLAQDGPHRQLGAVHHAGHPAAGRGAHEVTDQRVVAEGAGHRRRVGVRVEQVAGGCSAAAGRARRRARTGWPPLTVGAQLQHAVAVVQREAAAVGAAGHLLDPGHGAAGEELDQGRRTAGTLSGQLRSISECSLSTRLPSSCSIR